MRHVKLFIGLEVQLLGKSGLPKGLNMSGGCRLRAVLTAEGTVFPSMG